MKAVLLNKHGGPEILEYGDFPTPEPGPKEALVRLKAMALNGLDLWVLEGWPGFKIEYPHIIGADGAGEIAALGPQVSDWKLGDRVVINPNFSCGKCEFCLAGKDNQCQYWALLGEHRRGTFAEFA